MTDWAAEREDVLRRFTEELAKATGDGSAKRQAGTKPPWYIDTAHEAAMFSHLMKWKRGEKADDHSGAHPLVHLAWRALAIACKESGNTPVFKGPFYCSTPGCVWNLVSYTYAWEGGFNWVTLACGCGDSWSVRL